MLTTAGLKETIYQGQGYYNITNVFSEVDLTTVLSKAFLLILANHLTKSITHSFSSIHNYFSLLDKETDAKHLDQTCFFLSAKGVTFYEDFKGALKVILCVIR